MKLYIIPHGAADVEYSCHVKSALTNERKLHRTAQHGTPTESRLVHASDTLSVEP